MTSDAKRIARLEVQLRLLMLRVAGLVGVMLTGSGNGPVSVTGRSFVLLDETGAARAELSMKDGSPGLVLRDEKGVDRIVLSHEPEGTGLFVHDAEGTTRIGIAQFAHGGGGVALHGPHSKGAAVLYLKDEGSLRFFDAEGKVTNQVAGGGGEGN